MAVEIKFTINDMPGSLTATQQRDLAYEAFAEAYKRPENVPDPADPKKKIPNPESKEEHFGRWILSYVAETIGPYRKRVGLATTIATIEEENTTLRTSMAVSVSVTVQEV